MSSELVSTLTNAVLLIGVTLIAGSIGLKRFESIERRIDRFEGAMDRRFEGVDRRFETVNLRFDGVDRRFEAIDRRFEGVETSLGQRIDGLRTELKHDIALVDAHVGEVRSELAQTRSDLTYVALAVGARRAEGSS
jgi:hypothetical protein